VTNALPDNTGYVAAAYLVVFALVLVYLVIMARKLARFEREIVELNELAETRVAPERERAQSAPRMGTGEEVAAR
jgi:CcmD family protein